MHGTGYSQGSDESDTNTRLTDERRATDRHRAVCRVARVHRADDAGLWRVRNISDEGMMLIADVPVGAGEGLKIVLSEKVVLSGTVIWAEGGRCGVAFSERIDAAATLRALAEEQRAEGYRALRLPIEAKATLVLPGGARPIDLVDISQSGAGFIYNEGFAPGVELDLVLPGGELRRRALVRWSRGRRGGLWFTQPLERSDLESLARFQS